MMAIIALCIVAVTLASPVAAQPASNEQSNAERIKTRRAERDANRSQRLPSRPFTLREPLPLPVREIAPAGGQAVGKSCQSTDTACRIEFNVPSGKILVVTALWSAKEITCDSQQMGGTPTNGVPIAPWWQCAKSIAVKGTGAGFAGYLTDPATTK